MAPLVELLQKVLNLILMAIEIYSYTLFVWAIGSWFPQLTSTKFYRFIDSIVYPYASLFRKFIPPLGGFDFSIIVAFFALNLGSQLLATVFSMLFSLLAPAT